MDQETQKRINSDLDEAEQTAYEKEAMDRRQQNLAGSATPSPPARSQEPDTPLRYKGEGRVPLQAGSDFVVFTPKRPIHKVPRWLAEMHIEQWPDEWGIADDVPEYSEEAIEDHYDIDSAKGREALMRDFLKDPVELYEKITKVFWKKIHEQEKEIEQLRSENTGLKGKITSLTTPDRPHAPEKVKQPVKDPGIDFEEMGVDEDTALLIEPFLDPAKMDALMSEAKLNGGQQASLRSAQTEFLMYRNKDNAEKLAQKISKYFDLDEEANDPGDQGPNNNDDDNKPPLEA